MRDLQVFRTDRQNKWNNGENRIRTIQALAKEINRRIREELGITVSVGVSWNKIFAKFGSDYKKPDAITVITKDNFKSIVWPQPVEDLLYVVPATKRKLNGSCTEKATGILRAKKPKLVRRAIK